jgi:hypothetical protein
LESTDIYNAWLGVDWKTLIERQTGQLPNLPVVLIGEESIVSILSMVDAVACGWKIACSIYQFLTSQA